MEYPPRSNQLSEELDGGEEAPLLQREVSLVSNRLSSPLTAAQLQILDFYATRLLDENHRANLTGDRERTTIYRRHFVESLAILAALEVADISLSPLIDVGSGAGFPVLPMKIARPDLDVTLIEATGKKTRFLESIVSDLGLSPVRVLNGRAEEAGHDPGLRDSFSLAIGRAVAPLRVLLELTLPFLTIGGHLAAPKGSSAVREISEAEHALSVLGGEIVSRDTLDLPFEGPAQSLILVRKAKGTPDSYPRRPGIPNKRPL